MAQGYSAEYSRPRPWPDKEKDKVSEGHKMTTDEQIKVVAKVVRQNMPFENIEFNPETDEDCERRLRRMIGKKYLSWKWIKAVYDANTNGWPIYINLDLNWYFSFVTSNDAHVSREEILEAVKGRRPKAKEFIREDSP